MCNRKKIVAISYGDEIFSMSLKLNLWSAKHIGGADRTMAFTRDSLPKDFCTKNAEILSQKRGGGYWVWKPQIILTALEHCDEGDYLIYTDAGIVYSGPIRKLIDQMEKDGQSVFLSMGFAPLRHWCKRDAFVFMDAPMEEYGDLPCVSGGWVLLKKNEEAISFIQKWNHFIQNKHILTDLPNICGLPNAEDYREHRHDQAILTILAKQSNIMPYRSVSYVDCPKAHRHLLEGSVDAKDTPYGYTKEEMLTLMRLSRAYSSAEDHRKKRIFINTGIRNTSKLRFFKLLAYSMLKAIKADIWGKKHDGNLLNTP